jgi:hypothetical protein
MLTAAARAVVLSCALFVACRMEPAPGWSSPPADSPNSPPSTDPDAPAAAGGRGGATVTRGGSGSAETTGGSPSAARGGTGSIGGSGAARDAAPDDVPSGGDVGDDPTESAPDASAPVVCDAQSVSFEELRTGAVRVGARVAVTAVSTTQKFLLSHASSGGCLFGAYVGVEAVDGEPRGLLVVSYGDDAPQDLACPPGTDGIPDGLAPGDRVTLAGRFSTYVPSSCSDIAPSPQLLVESTCPVVVSSRGTPLDAVTLPFDTADSVALGVDVALLRRLAGGLVRLEGVTALPAADGYGAVGPYGVVRFAETRLPLTNDVRYGDLTLGGPGDSEKSLRLAETATFDAVTGVVHLDYCAWSLAPRDPCTDAEPPPDACR